MKCSSRLLHPSAPRSADQQDLAGWGSHNTGLTAQDEEARRAKKISFTAFSVQQP